jgi:hypothetical protein
MNTCAAMPKAALAASSPVRRVVIDNPNEIRSEN